MTGLATRLSKQALRLIPAKIPPAVRAPLLAELAPRVAAAGAVLALEERWPRDGGGDRTKTEGYLRSAPPLTEEEWLRFFRLMAEGKLPLIHSMPGIERAILARMPRQPLPEGDPLPGSAAALRRLRSERRRQQRRKT